MLAARHTSLYQRLKSRGLLDAVMRQLLDGEKDAKAMARWLKMEGVETSASGVYAMLRTHGFGWRYDQSRAAAEEMALPADMDEAAAITLRRKLQVATLEADGLKELRVLAQISGESAKLAQGERKVRIAEAEMERKLTETRMKGAEFVDELLAQAEKLEAARRERARLVADKASDRQRLEGISRIMWGTLTGEAAA